MRKGYKRRRGLVALLSAFVLVFVLSIPMFAVDSSAVVDSSGNYGLYVTVSGTYYFETGSTVLEYIGTGESYTIESGSISGYSNGSSVSDNFVTLQVDTDSGNLVLMTRTSGTYTMNVAYTSNVIAEDPEFTAYSNTYLVFNNAVIEYQGPIYNLLINTMASTSSLVFVASSSGSGIVDVIVDGFNGIITGLGSGVADFFQTLFIANDGTGNLSVFAIVSLVFIGVAVAFGIARWIIKKVG